MSTSSLSPIHARQADRSRDLPVGRRTLHRSASQIITSRYRSSDKARLPTELRATVVRCAPRSTLPALVLVNREFRDLAKPRLWQRLAFDTRTQPLASLRVLLGAKLFPRVCHLIVRLDIFVGKGKAHVDNVGVLFAISSLMMRLPNLRVCTIEVSQQADATATQLIQALHFAASPLTHLTIDWYIPVSIDLQEMLFHALSTHRYSLDALALYFSDGTTMCPGELSMLEVLQHLTLGRCSVTEVPVNSVAKETVGPLASLLTLDLDASIDFTSLCTIILPIVPYIESLTVYLIFLNGDSDETMMAKLPPLPSLLHLRFLELRNVEANELGIALRHLGPLSSVISLTVSGNVRDMRTIVRTLEETLDGSSAGTLRCLRRLELEREGPPPLSMGPERDELQLALVSLQKSLAARSIAVTSRCLD